MGRNSNYKLKSFEVHHRLANRKYFFFFRLGFQSHSFQNMSLYLLDWMERCDNYR